MTKNAVKNSKKEICTVLRIQFGVFFFWLKKERKKKRKLKENGKSEMDFARFSVDCVCVGGRVL